MKQETKLPGTIKRMLLLVTVILSLNSCFRHYYKTNSTDHVNADAIQKLISADKYFILHNSNNEACAFTNLRITNDSLEGNTEVLSAGHTKYLNPRDADKNRFSVGAKDTVLYEVHLYSSVKDTVGSFVRIPLADVKRMDVYTLDKFHTRKSAILSTVGTVLTAGAIVAVIIASSSGKKQSSQTITDSVITCSPQIYSISNNANVLNGTLCSGAIYASLSRTDYLPINNMPVNPGNLSLLLKGDKNEELMMKDFRLIRITHDAAQNALMDKSGKVFTYNHPVAANHAFTDDGNDIVNDINAPDEKYYSFTNEAEDGFSSDVVLDFKKPLNAATGNLIVKAKNSGWGYYVFNEFKKLYGDHYQSMLEQKDKAKPSTMLQCEIDQNLPLLVSVRDGKDWKLVDYFFTPGNAAPREMIMQLNLAGFTNKDHLQIRLQTAYMFWDIDYVAMDFSNSRPLSVSYTSPASCIKTGSPFQQARFSTSDSSFFHINAGERLVLEFSIDDDAPGTTSSYFLEGNGYYHDNSIFKGKPQLTELGKCSGKGGFDKFSRRKFEETLEAFNHQQSDTKKDFEILR